jgi:hypothetical protein
MTCLPARNGVNPSVISGFSFLSSSKQGQNLGFAGDQTGFAQRNATVAVEQCMAQGHHSTERNQAMNGFAHGLQ